MRYIRIDSVNICKVNAPFAAILSKNPFTQQENIIAVITSLFSLFLFFQKKKPEKITGHF